MKSPVLLHVPHASLRIPFVDRAAFALDEADLQAELLRMTDRHTEALFELPGADRLVFPVSRLVVDPERFRDDADEPMAVRGMGAVYTRTHDGRTLRRVADREALLSAYYDPHHEALDRWAAEAVRRTGHALIVDAHSFPTDPLPCDLDQTVPRPDTCIGTDPFHTPSSLTVALEEALRDEGWSVEIDRPYAGTMVPAWAYRREPRVRSVMVEIRRGLTMDEATGERLPTFDDVRSRLSRVLARLVAAFGRS